MAPYAVSNPWLSPFPYYQTPTISNSAYVQPASLDCQHAGLFPGFTTVHIFYDLSGPPISWITSRAACGRLGPGRPESPLRRPPLRGCNNSPLLRFRTHLGHRRPKSPLRRPPLLGCNNLFLQANLGHPWPQSPLRRPPLRGCFNLLCTPGSPVAPKSSAEATPSGVQTTFPAAAAADAAAAAKKTGGPRPGARRGRKPRRHLCPHCLKWGGHRPEDCFARPRAAAAPAAASVVNNFTVMPGAVVQAGPGGSTSGRPRAVKQKKQKKN
ncbi:uncharacterized protein FMAN_00332 [Fusarium mangiferae]|uniref:Uncharacterized protein n=1 Tax=Fusarium mangiferae TaxID=192010 RepID=A0A1L7U4N8_FUSMA|nr:uncharacterized protein FMAN_00332 [Fusarium mangiferae]CVL02925.1 uncharacterized protein FMAN_00332 [Fusarium mangiferae]